MIYTEFSIVINNVLIILINKKRLNLLNGYHLEIPRSNRPLRFFHPSYNSVICSVFVTREHCQEAGSALQNTLGANNLKFDVPYITQTYTTQINRTKKNESAWWLWSSRTVMILLDRSLDCPMFLGVKTLTSTIWPINRISFYVSKRKSNICSQVTD